MSAAREPTKAQRRALHLLANGHEILFIGGLSPSARWSRPGSAATFRGLRVDTFLAMRDRGWLDERARIKGGPERYGISGNGRAALATSTGEQP